MSRLRAKPPLHRLPLKDAEAPTPGQEPKPEVCLLAGRRGHGFDDTAPSGPPEERTPAAQPHSDLRPEALRSGSSYSNSPSTTTKTSLSIINSPGQHHQRNRVALLSIWLIIIHYLSVFLSPCHLVNHLRKESS